LKAIKDISSMHFAKKSILISAALVLIGAGCVQFSGSATSGLDGGVFKSADRGATWVQKSAIATTEGQRSIGSLNITALAQDPADAKALYAGTDSQGLFFTLDAAESWQHVSELGRIRVNAVAVSAGNKCHVFVATGNRVLRSTDCSRSWQNVYFDSRSDAEIVDIDIDHFSSETVFAATSKGDLLKSADNGGSWSPVHRFQNQIRDVVMSSSDSRVMYVATQNRGLWKTADSGDTWTDLTEHLGEFAGATDNMLLAEASGTPNAIILASHYGLLRSRDGGASWSAIPLLTPPGSTVIYAIAVSPKDSNAIYYGTASAFYRTVDGGAKWVTATNPTSRAVTNLHIDTSNDANLYMGTTALLKQRTGF